MAANANPINIYSMMAEEGGRRQTGGFSVYA
jgi:hypothetical protein